MKVEEIQKRFSLSRESASRLLKISIRTLDRYIKTKKLSTRVIDGRIWLDKEETERFKVGKYGKIKVDNVDMSTLKVSIDKRVDNVDKVVDKVDKVEILDQEPVARDENNIYKKIYSELKEDLREKQERLEIANYRVGQLEAQLRNSVPMLEYHRENYNKEKREEDLKNKLQESTSIIKKLSYKLKQVKFNKRIFIIILLSILALQPLWLLLLRPPINPFG